ncbi:hypothetical protein KXR64_20115 [Brucella intermedia]|uniref:hypothetical protein n=1 Tax=Brucella TaxID=234 RepID=UPI0009461407|nr:hypothetical protein [Brucella intermedia]
MGWEKRLNIAAIPLSVILAVAGLLGRTAAAIAGLILAAMLVVAILMLRLLTPAGIGSEYAEVLACKRSRRFVAVHRDGGLVLGDQKTQVKAASHEIASIDLKINEVAVPRCGSRLMWNELSAKCLIDSVFLEITMKNPAVPSFMVHLLREEDSCQAESAAFGGIAKKAVYWLDNLIN